MCSRLPSTHTTGNTFYAFLRALRGIPPSGFDVSKTSTKFIRLETQPHHENPERIYQSYFRCSSRRRIVDHDPIGNTRETEETVFSQREDQRCRHRHQWHGLGRLLL